MFQQVIGASQHLAEALDLKVSVHEAQGLLFLYIHSGNISVDTSAGVYLESHLSFDDIASLYFDPMLTMILRR
jgi:hypothetical protein